GDGLAGAPGTPAVGACVERAGEGATVRAPGRVPCRLDGAGRGLRSRVREEHALLARAGREAREPLAQRGEALEVKIAAADVQEPTRRLLDRLHHPGMAVARGRDRDPGHEVEIAVPVHVLDHGAL